MRKNFLLLAAIAATPLMAASPAAAQIYPWCAQYSGATGASNCGFTSRQQCEVNVRGAGGFCYQNPMWVPPSERPRRDRRQHNDN